MFAFTFLEASITDNNALLCPLNSFKLIFQTKLMQKFKKTTHLFSLCRSLILNLMYLCNFGSSSSGISIWGSPLCPLSNATSLIQIGFSKKMLCTISQDDLIIDLSRRANLYEVPCVTVSTFGSKKYIQETIFCPLSIPSYKISIWCSERKLWRFSPGHLFGM